jgi:hypothetical protein
VRVASLSLVLASLTCLFTAPALADPVAQPAEESVERSRAAGEGASGVGQSWHKRSWEAAAFETTVVAPMGERLKENERIGTYKQPRWTANRRFPTTRIYVAPAGTLNLEYWLTPKIDLSNAGATTYKSMYEAEFGLGNRLQLDLYMTVEQSAAAAADRKNKMGDVAVTEEKLELRYALADWGQIYSNPTLYAEVARSSAAAPRFELKLLLGDELSQRWHWGVNLIWEREMLADLVQEYAATGGLSYTVEDMLLSAGLEFQAKVYDHVKRRFKADKYAIMAGPSLSWRPVPPMRVLLVGLFGARVDRNKNVSKAAAEPTLIVGWEL